MKRVIDSDVVEKRPERKDARERRTRDVHERGTAPEVREEFLEAEELHVSDAQCLGWTDLGHGSPGLGNRPASVAAGKHAQLAIRALQGGWDERSRKELACI